MAKRQNIDRARTLRRDATEAEKRLWWKLREHRVGAAKFVRQAPIGPYIVDFVCRRRKLIVEVDGGQHADSQADEVRTRFLEKQGYRVLRFWNGDVLQNIEGVLIRIAEALSELADPPHPNPAGHGPRAGSLPVGERESERARCDHLPDDEGGRAKRAAEKAGSNARGEA